ncbi:hypothetical protein [Flagellimonas amoyensis]|uniref:hypothetical protein n=1 Tax=Flagellimonas amoyensis TaxID=2169401 RepID=UPI000D3898D6|nr:hypothetical protein [Allomuricauda amoyensis]
MTLDDMDRTDNYLSIGNFAAFAETSNPEDPTKKDRELMVWMEETLEVNNWDELHGNHYFGTFTKL